MSLSHGSETTEFNRELGSLESTPRFSQQSNLVLETIPSLSVYNTRDEDEEGDGLWRTATFGDNIFTANFSFSNEKGVSLLEGVEETEENSSVFDGAIETPPLYLAMGLGADVCELPSSVIKGGVSGASDFQPAGNGSEVEDYYKKMVEENPCNSLFLKNYALFLYQSKGDFEGAEAYYSCAVFLEPSDGETLAQFAKLIWEQHHDQKRAARYFQQAVQAAPTDSEVLAAYAKFLWETEEAGGDEDGQSQDSEGALIPQGALSC